MEAPAKEKAEEKTSVANNGRRKLLQVQYEEDYLQALISTKEKILRVEGPDMKEAMQDDFRQWYMEHKRANGIFPEFPKEEVWQLPGFKFSGVDNAAIVVEVTPGKDGTD
jgi:IQ and AAA domain-containing protein